MIEQINKAIEYFEKCLTLWIGDSAHNQAALSALREQEARQWIPVSDGLPESGEEYLIANGSIVKTAYLDGAKDWVGDRNIILKYVTHWMPLPNPPKEEA